MYEILLFTLNIIWATLTLLFLMSIGKIYLTREQLPKPGSADKLPKISIVIPARDEATNIGECLQCIMLLDYPKDALEIIVVDDNSSDGTAEIIKEYAVRDKRINLISCESLPEGWMGKSHACWQGVQSTTSEWLLFVDADTYLKSSAAHAAIDYALSTKREFLSVIPFQRIISLQERISLPGVFLGFASAIDFNRVNDPDDTFAIANGQFLLFSRDAYDRIGGHKAIRAEVSDDLAFARAAQQLRINSYTLFGEEHIETRMYRSLREVWNGFSKNALEIIHATSKKNSFIAALLSICLAGGTFLPLIMWVTATEVTTQLWDISFIISVTTLFILMLSFAITLFTLRIPIVYLIAFPFGLATHSAIIIQAYFRHKKGNRIWKGRNY